MLFQLTSEWGAVIFRSHRRAVNKELHAHDADVVGALAVRVTVPETVEPAAGAVTETVGGVVSGGGGARPPRCSCRSGSRRR